jgi:membrane protein DedA with SNARE-associated domain
VNESIEFLRSYGPMLVFTSVLLEQAGIPIPCTPWLIASGALARLGQGTVAVPIALATLAASMGHSVWFFAGRHWGNGVLRVVCKVSLEPEICVQRTENTFTRYGARALIIAPFVPGLTTLAPPLAGMSGMKYRRFLALDGMGDLLWATTFVGLGWIAGGPFFRGVEIVMAYAGSAAGFFAGGLALYLAYKLLQRLRFRAKLRVARLTAGELKQRLDGGEELVLVDLRHRREVEESGNTLPGAIQISPEELYRRHGEIARGRDVVLFCS